MFRSNKPRIDIKQYLKEMRMSQSAISCRSSISSQDKERDRESGSGRESPVRQQWTEMPRQFSQGQSRRTQKEDFVDNIDSSSVGKRQVRQGRTEISLQTTPEVAKTQAKILLPDLQTTQIPFQDPHHKSSFGIQQQKHQSQYLMGYGNTPNSMSPFFPCYQYPQYNPSMSIPPLQDPQQPPNHSQMPQYPYFMYPQYSPPMSKAEEPPKTLPKKKQNISYDRKSKLSKLSESDSESEQGAPGLLKKMNVMLSPLVDSVREGEEILCKYTSKSEKYLQLLEVTTKKTHIEESIESVQDLLVSLNSIQKLHQVFITEKNKVAHQLEDLSSDVIMLFRLHSS